MKITACRFIARDLGASFNKVRNGDLVRGGISCLPEPIKDGSLGGNTIYFVSYLHPICLTLWPPNAIFRISSRFQSTALNGPFPNLRRLRVRHRHLFPYLRNTVHRLTPFYGTSECLDTLHSCPKLENFMGSDVT